MDKNLLIMTLVLIFAYGAPAKAQADVRIYSIQYKPAQASALDERFEKCMRESHCPQQLRLQLMDEFYVKMGQTISNIKAICAKANYSDCLSSQKKNVSAWHQIQDRMTSLMLAMEGRSPGLLAHKEQ